MNNLVATDIYVISPQGIVGRGDLLSYSVTSTQTGLAISGQLRVTRVLQGTGGTGPFIIQAIYPTDDILAGIFTLEGVIFVNSEGTHDWYDTGNGHTLVFLARSVRDSYGNSYKVEVNTRKV